MIVKQCKIIFMIIMITSLFVGCGDNDSGNNSEQWPLISVEAIDEFENYEAIENYLNSLEGGETHTMTSSLGGYDTIENALENGNTQVQSWNDYYRIFKQLLIDTGLWEYMHAALTVQRHKIKFTVTRDGVNHEETGLLVRRWSLGYSEDPVVILNHPTDTLRENSPSRHENERKGWLDGTGSKLLALWLATMKFTVILPDYPGMGDNYEVHPYCMTSLAKSDNAMLDAVRKMTTWKESGNIYLLGYSEGGYVTLAAAKLMRSYPTRYNLKGVIPLAGPHDLSGTMRDLMLTAGHKYPTPYFLPYTIRGYGAGYPEVKAFQFDKAVMDTPAVDGKNFYTRLEALLKGDYTGAVISNLMETVVTKEGGSYSGPLSITTDLFQTALNDEEDVINKKLLENTLPGTDFVPISTTNYLFAHYKDDDCVPVGNLLAVQKQWPEKDYTNLQYDIFHSTAPFGKEDMGTYHAAALPQAYVRALKFILKQEGRWSE